MWRLIKNDEFTVAFAEMAQLKPGLSTEFTMLWVFVTAATHYNGNATMHDLKSAIDRDGKLEGRALRTVVDLARAIHAGDWYTARRCAETIRHYRPDARRKTLFSVLSNILNILGHKPNGSNIVFAKNMSFFTAN